MGKKAARLAKRISDRSKNANPVTTPEPTSGRVAVPVSKRAYHEMPKKERALYTVPGYAEMHVELKNADGTKTLVHQPNYEPDKTISPNAYGMYTRQTDPPVAFTTYDIYTYWVYAYSTYNDYLEGKAAGSLTSKVAEFELSFNVHLWKVAWDKSSPPQVKSMRLNPDILQAQPREVAMHAYPCVGKEERKGKFAIVLFSLDNATGLVWWESDTKKDKDGNIIELPPRPVLRYGEITEDRPRGKNCSPCIAVHTYGPAGSEGCATTPLQKYVFHKKRGDRAGLVAWENDLTEWMKLGKHDARILLPAKDSDPPYEDFTHWRKNAEELFSL